MARKTNEQRGHIGAWLVASREAKGWTQDGAIQRLQRRGWHGDPSSYRQWEAGNREPNDENLAMLVALYGSEPPPPPTRQDPLVRAVREHTRMLHDALALRDEVTALRHEVALLARDIERLTKDGHPVTGRDD